MLKNIIAIFLSLTFLLLVKVAADSLNVPTVPEEAEQPVAEKQVPPAKTAQNKPVKFNPTVPTPLPDLNEGYLFNEERYLVDESELQEEVVEEEDDSLKVKMDTLYYAGSIIIGDQRKALVSYAIDTSQVVKQAKDRKKSPKNLKQREYAQLALGDSISGYKVAAIESDRLVLEKGTESIEKMLYDSSKVRLAPPAKKKIVKKRPAPAQKANTKRVALDSGKKTTRPLKAVRRLPRSIPAPKRQITPQIPGVPPSSGITR